MERMRFRVGTECASSPPLTDYDPKAWEEKRAAWYNKHSGRKQGAYCSKCNDRGFSYYVDEDGYTIARDCVCKKLRKTIAMQDKSGLGEMLKRCTMDTWAEAEPWQKSAKKMAQSYAEQPDGWFLMGGTPGTGKTHLCTAICGELLSRHIQVHYVLWRDTCQKAKSVVNDRGAYDKIVQPMKDAEVLYLDDLFKTGGGNPTDADVNLAFEVLNYRYLNREKLTIISTEKTIEQLVAIDEALGSRIYERCKSNYLNLSGRENWRFRRNA